MRGRRIGGGWRGDRGALSRGAIGAGVATLFGVIVVSAVAWAAGSVSGQDGGDSATVGASTSSSWFPVPGATGSVDTNEPQGESCRSQAVALSPSAGFDLPPGGPTPGNWYVVTCVGSDAAEPDSVRVEWIPSTAGGGPAPPARPVAALVVAERAAASIVLPSPVVRLDPTPFSVVNLTTWLAVDPEVWRPYRATATAGTVSATAVATPVEVTWTMGDGGVVDCDGPGTEYRKEIPPGAQEPSCSYTYRRSSDGEPSADGNANDDAFPVTATVTWSVSWSATGAAGGGTLPSLHTATTVPVRVEQVESVEVGGR